MTFGIRRERPLRVRLFDEEDDTERYRRLGWDPRKTYEENMGYIGLFDRPDEELEWPDVKPAPSRFNHVGVSSGTADPYYANHPEVVDYDGPDIEQVVVTAPREQGLVQLPQTLQDEFRTYGTPVNGEAQYGLPAAMYVIGEASSRWRADGSVPFNVGNLSKRDLSPYDGRSRQSDHTNGTGIDIRPVRMDGKNAPVTYKDPGYDRDATQRLVDTLLATGGVEVIYFDDPEIKGVTPQRRHDNHLHVRVNPNYRRRPGS